MSKKLEKARAELKRNPEVEHFKKKLAKLLYEEISRLSGEGQTEEMDKLLKELETLAKRNPTVDEIQLEYGKAIFNALPILSIRATITKVKDMINELRTIANTTQNILLKELIAMILVNSIYDFSVRGSVTTVHDFALELTDLARTHQDNKKIQLASAKGIMNAVNFFKEKNDLEAARDYFRILLKIIEANPKEEMVDTRKLRELKEFFKK